MASLRTSVHTAAAVPRRGVLTARLGDGRAQVQVGECLIQAAAETSLATGQSVLLLEWPGGAAALPLAGLGLPEFEEVIIHHG